MDAGLERRRRLRPSDYVQWISPEPGSWRYRAAGLLDHYHRVVVPARPAESGCGT